MKESTEDRGLRQRSARRPVALPPDKVGDRLRTAEGRGAAAVLGPSWVSVATIKQLQATAGNRAVQRLLDARSPASPLMSAQRQDTAGPAVDGKKEVSSKGMERLELSRDAVDYTRRVLAFGAGNQLEALNATGVNSYYRMRVVRGSVYWEIAPDVQEIAKDNPEALEAAKVEMVHGGNCREYSRVALSYLRVTAKSETLNLAQCDSPDHVFTVIGNRRTDPVASLAAADPWPTRPTACLFEDHFMYPHRNKLDWIHTSVADGQNVKDVILAGLKLTEAGRRTAEKTPNEVEYKAIMKMLRRKNYLWDQKKSVLPGHDFEYVPRREN